jgi:hypothetical protein
MYQVEHVSWGWREKNSRPNYSNCLLKCHKKLFSSCFTLAIEDAVVFSVFSHRTKTFSTICATSEHGKIVIKFAFILELTNHTFIIMNYFLSSHRSSSLKIDSFTLFSKAFFAQFYEEVSASVLSIVERLKFSFSRNLLLMV